MNQEPHACQSAFAVGGLIFPQIEGDAELNHDTARGSARAPILLWGPCLWAAGKAGHKPDDLSWHEECLAQGGTPQRKGGGHGGRAAGAVHA
ncbi:MAG: hypothetical protein K6T86_02115 [Pirellulales bacterium]|nr:hypothetical protein [Pirellulales bacterium]